MHRQTEAIFSPRVKHRDRGQIEPTMADNLTGRAALPVLPGKMSLCDTSRHDNTKSTGNKAEGTQKTTDPYKVRVDRSTKVGLFKLLDKGYTL